MEKKSRKALDNECYRLLLENSLKSIPFNVFIALLLCVYLYFTKVPLALTLTWFLGICLLSIGRFYNSKFSLKKFNILKPNHSSLKRFIFLTFLMGTTWGSFYILLINYINPINEVNVILILGGLSAGSLASLSVYLPAYYAYLLPLFLPIIIYNYSLYSLERTILATTFLLFVIMLAITAKITSKLLQNTVKLNFQLELTNKKLKATNKKLSNSLVTIKTMSITDALTGLYNRRFFNEKIKAEYNRAKRHHYPLNLIFIDVDNFKMINDSFGHPMGDKYLADIAKVIKEYARRGDDTVFRLGGDEFAVIAANSSLNEVTEHFSYMKEELKKMIPHQSISLSIGVICVLPTGKELIDNLISAADKTLYQAKKSGKDKIVCQTV
ncbi:GGDEF domain-containing protein [Legionella gresilensis]|uniref:GGDEF domain-containing protein n=1 Tax=Legionella gresilensis TaxID=91823 RepID=UPI0013EFBC82|nr:GGDEF domain-containing protein [Legionella gresilensis]